MVRLQPRRLRDRIAGITDPAVQGNAPAQFNPGNKFAKGRGVPESLAFTIPWRNLGAAQGSWIAVKNKKTHVLMMVLGLWNRAMVGAMASATNSVVFPNEKLFWISVEF